ncbi:MAG TPA: DUF3006 domain-containing protein, partial [Gemmatimonadales bacterium]|nr:DUF3006 domain-containing protein [Gemmatimonadales bacterium]
TGARGEGRGALFAVDRIEGQIAVVVGDDGKAHDVARSELPQGTREGSVLRAPLLADGSVDWSHARLDEAERKRRLAESRERLDRLRSRDPGGDIVL